MSSDDLQRSNITDEIVGHLRAGTNVNLVGLRASGRSATMSRVVEHLVEGGVRVTRITGVQALHDRPLGALAVAGINISPSPNSLNMLMSAVECLEEALATKPSVLTIDDADDLDASTIGAIAAVHARLHTPVVITSRPTGCRRSDAGALIAALQPGVRITLPPLRFEEVHRLVHQLLGGPVEPMTVARIAAKSGGLPGLVTAMVRTGRASVRLAPRGGLWVARGDLWTTPLAQSVEPFLDDLDEASLDAITVLSHAGPVSMAGALRLVPAEKLSVLEDFGLLRVLPEGDDALVGVFPPLIAEYIKHEGSTTRRMLVRGRLAAAPDREPVPALAPGPPARPSADPLLSRRLSAHWHTTLAAHRLTWDTDPSPSNAIPLLGSLLTCRALPHEIDAILTDTVTDAADDESLARLLVLTAFSEALGAGRIDAAQERLREARPAQPRFDGLVRATQAHLQLLTDSVPDVADLADPPESEPHLSHEAVVVVRAQTLVASGQAQAALDLLAAFTTDEPYLARAVDVTRELALLYTCDVDRAVTLALVNVERSRRAHDPAGVEEHSYVAGMGLAFRGRLVELDDLVASALSLSPMPHHTSHVQTGLLALWADVARWQGRHAYADSLAVQSTGLGRRTGPHPGMSADGIAAQARKGEEKQTADELWAIAEDRLDRGYLPAGIIAGVAAVEAHPDATRAARLLDAAAACDCPLPVHLAAYAAAIASGAPRELAELEPHLLGAGLRLYAVRTAVARSVNMLLTGDLTGAVEQADAAWNKAGLRGRDLCGLFRRFDRAVSLTAREREIAVLVARGMSSNEIAVAKVISIRTVENHVFSACRKVGVDTREGLARAAQTWLSCAIE
ncbi:regulatory protein, luxR family [Sanguibacter gelidistatuariae]|uniref:Regulatory protein, luxR family n=1 Tax=Sanguibacter gelidistatuariae TaxID=1814289 RepID=A0A1G6N1S1_9MICO|nr:helix-turn-helix transcriptional regulator [Sanguibacter gelidistatuariae]SDC61186.1 regulatory protein, luxR family [Sanguibacter gelidistatuariae]